MRERDRDRQRQRETETERQRQRENRTEEATVIGCIGERDKHKNRIVVTQNNLRERFFLTY